MTIIEKIKAEIERRKAKAEAERVLYPKTILSANNFLLINEYVELLSFLDTLESEKLMDGLEEEVKRWLKEGEITDTRYDDYDDNDIEATARHFAKWGAEHLKK